MAALTILFACMLMETTLDVADSFYSLVPMKVVEVPCQAACSMVCLDMIIHTEAPDLPVVALPRACLDYLSKDQMLILLRETLNSALCPVPSVSAIAFFRLPAQKIPSKETCDSEELGVGSCGRGTFTVGDF